MPQLKKIQQYFCDAIYNDMQENLAAAITHGNIANKERIRIYQDNVLITLYETLKSRYPAILKLVGEDFFKHISREYIKKNQPTSGNLDEYGLGFVEFIAAVPTAQDFGYLSDVAKLEWALHKAYFAADAEPLDRQEFAKIPPEQLSETKLTLHPSVQLISSPYPIDKIWQIAQDDYEGDTDININERGSEILIIRPEYKIETILLEPGEFAFLSELHSGSTLYQAFEKAVETNPNFDFATALQKFVNNGTFVGF